ncbi:hypothetical protein GUJ93_ZPchr0008g12697 [Zizania palustris]|uniref:FAD-binding 8 domain-containing protein n=1 Tax=Zizania palustris TaxID=103762 RepID=A0A8J5RDF6_ZIZPA|nr:hypothetical protein GUJ93_ZPchr0008g12697 [Zizania palustris]
MLFSASANIEIFGLDFQSDSPDLPLLASAPSADRFSRLSWSRPGATDGDSFSLGLLAGGLSDGSVAVWNPLSMIRYPDQAAQRLQHVLTWMYLAIPILLYAGERIFWALRSHGFTTVRIEKVAVYPGNVIAIHMTKPDGFTYKSGQYIYVNCGEVS